MDKILVHGGSALNGTVRISGSKNSALGRVCSAGFAAKQRGCALITAD